MYALTLVWFLSGQMQGGGVAYLYPSAASCQRAAPQEADLKQTLLLEAFGAKVDVYWFCTPAKVHP